MSVQIELFGDFSLRVDNEVVDVRAQKAKALLAWLVCHPEHPQPRDRLVGLFWADRSVANAKTSLRQALTGLRKVLPENALLARGDALVLNHDLVSSDVASFKAMHSDMSREMLSETLAIYDGDLLSDFNARSAAFDE